MCLHPIVSHDNLDRPIETTKYQHELDNCDYFELTDPIDASHGDLLVMQLNIRGLFGKLSNLKDLINKASWVKELTSFSYVRPGKTKIVRLPLYQVITIFTKAGNIKLGEVLEYL